MAAKSAVSHLYVRSGSPERANSASVMILILRQAAENIFHCCETELPCVKEERKARAAGGGDEESTD